MQKIAQWMTSYPLKQVVKWLLVDCIIILAATLLTLTTSLDYQPKLYFVGASIIVSLITLYFNGIYRHIWSRTSIYGIVLIFRSMLIAYLILVCIFLVITPRVIPITELTLSNIFALIGLVVLRYHSRLIDVFQRHWRGLFTPKLADNVARILIIGTGEGGQAIASTLQHRINNKNYQIIGFVDDSPEIYGMYVEGKPVVGNIAAIPKLVHDYQIDLIIIAIHSKDSADLRRILELCHTTNAGIKIVPNMQGWILSDDKTPLLLQDVQAEDLIGRRVITRHSDIDMTPISKRVTLVTGGAGSIGAELCRQILDIAPEKLIILDNNESALHDLHTQLTSHEKSIEIIPILADVTQVETLSQIFKDYQPQIVYHAAAYKHVPLLEFFPNEAIRTNILGTLNMTELAVLHQVERFVFISSDKAVEPSSVMGASKRICELILHFMSEKYGKQTLFTSVRFGNVLGSRGSVIPTFTWQIDNGGPVTVTDKAMTRYFMSISEAVNLVLHAAAMTIGDEIFVLKMGDVVHIIDIAERMIRLRGLRPHIDIPIHFMGIRPGEKLHEELYTYSQEPVATDHPKIVKLSKWAVSGNAHNFIEQVSQLIETGIPAHQNALDYLLRFCQIGEEEAL